MPNNNRSEKIDLLGPKSEHHFITFGLVHWFSAHLSLPIRHTRLEQMFNEALAEKVHNKYLGPGSTVGQYYNWKDGLIYRLKEKAMTGYMVSSQVARDYARITVGRLERCAKTLLEKKHAFGQDPT